MFLRRHRQHAHGETCEYGSLAKAVRTALGPRHQVVARLGKYPAAAGVLTVTMEKDARGHTCGMQFSERTEKTEAVAAGARGVSAAHQPSRR